MQDAKIGNVTTIGFDADDALWQNERFFRITGERFPELLRDHAAPDHPAERCNPGHCGFGTKGFILSMMETAIAAGGWGVFIPGGLAWGQEHAEAPRQHPRFRQIADMQSLCDIVEAR